MKKLLIFALCLLGICNARAEMMTAQEIVLTEAYRMQPWDSEEEEELIYIFACNLVMPCIGMSI